MKKHKKDITDKTFPENKPDIYQNISRETPVDNYNVQGDWYRTIVKSTSEGFILRDLSGRILDVNDATCSSLGYTREELLKMRINDISLPMVGKTEEENLETLREFHEHDLIPYGSCSFEKQHLCKDGSIMEVFVSNGYLDVSDGLVFCFHRDITEQKKLYQQLKESEERYRSLIELGDTIGEAVVMLKDVDNCEGKHTFISDTWSQITGYTKDELLKISFFDILQPAYRQSVIDRHRRKIKGERNPDHYEASIARKDGGIVYIEMTSGYTQYQENPVNVLYIRDITERKKIEEVLHFSVASFKAIKEGIVITDLNDNIINWNEASELIYKVKSSEAIGKKYSDIIKVIKPSKFVQENELIKLYDVGHTYSEYLIKTENIQIWVDVSKQLIKSKNGENIAILAIVSDITERKNLEVAIKKYQER
ncbi:MAG: PAS domain-containing protein, partial [Eubacteriales bacterium]